MSGQSGRVLKGATVLHLDPPAVERADVRIEGGRITALGPSLAPQPGDAVDTLEGQWIIPGLVCAHTHLYSALATGMPAPSEAPVSFADMLAKVWWKLDRALDDEGVEVSALVGGVGALQAGVTTVVDHHASPSAIVGSLGRIDGALASLGLRRILCYEVTDRGGPEEARAGLAAHEALLALGNTEHRAVMVGAHANFTLSDATLRSVGELAKAAGVGVHIHVAEAVDDAQLTGCDPVARLDRIGALLPGSILAHCVHLAPEALQRISDAGAWVTHQPRSNQNNAVGHAPIASFGANTALGTDGIGSDMFAELQAAWFRAQEANVGWSPERWLGVLTASARLAREKLGIPVGQIGVGGPADLVVLAPPPGPPVRADSIAASMLFRLHAGCVRHVMVDGSWRLWDRMVRGVDTAGLAQRAQRVARETWDRMG